MADEYPQSKWSNKIKTDTTGLKSRIKATGDSLDKAFDRGVKNSSGTTEYEDGNATYNMKKTDIKEIVRLKNKYVAQEDSLNKARKKN